MKIRKKTNKIRERREVRNRKATIKVGVLRLSVFRSNKSVYAQGIDDAEGKTLISASVKDVSLTDLKKVKTEQAKLVGEALAKKAKEKGITKVFFDRGKFRYHGRVKALAEGARLGGLVF